MPVVLTGPASSQPTIQAYIEFLTLTLGAEAVSRITTIIGDPVGVTEHIQCREEVKKYRLATNDAYYFNWTMHIPSTLLSPFVPTHESMLALDLDRHAASNSRVRTPSFVFWHRRRQRQNRDP